MNTASHNNHTPSPANREAERLLAWLREWEIEQVLRDAPDTPLPEPRHAAQPARAVPEDRPPEPGQVRLLAPVFPETSVAPIFLMILRDEDNGLFLAAPYSPFATPAIPGELAFAEQAPALTVLCLWNAALLPVALLDDASWFVETVSAAIRDAGLRVWQALMDGNPPPDGLRSAIGPRLVHPEDPRHTYLREQRLRMDAIRGLSGATASRAVLQFVPWQQSDFGSGLPMAAEDEALYGARRTWSVPGKGCRVVIEQATRGAPCQVTVRKTNGHPSTALDGVRVLGRLACVTIEAGAAGLPPSAAADGIILLAADGTILPLDSQ